MSLELRPSITLNNHSRPEAYFMDNGQIETELAEMRLDEEVPLYNEQRSEAIFKFLRKGNVKSVLDVGCGLGKVSVYLAKKGLDVTGIDISERLINLAKKKAAENKVKIHFENMPLEKFYPERTFDAVLFAGVLEHIEDEESMMQEAKRLMNESGKIVITDKPTFNFLFTPRDRLIGHKRRYTKSMLRKKLESQSYGNISMKYYNFLMLFGTLYLKFFNKEEYPYGTLNPSLNKLMHWWYKHVENQFMFPIGDRIFAMAEPLSKEKK